MKTATCTIAGLSPYSQSRHITEPRGPKETAKDHEARCWRDRIHSDESGGVYIPPMAFKNALSECAKFLSIQVPGKGKATYTKHFEAGLLVLEMVPLLRADGSQWTKDSVPGEWLFLPSDGVRGSGKRVDKCYPYAPDWRATFTAYIGDDTITKEVFERVLNEAGQFIGIGRFRPRNNGYYGRFKVESVKWS